MLRLLSVGQGDPGPLGLTPEAAAGIASHGVVGNPGAPVADLLPVLAAGPATAVTACGLGLLLAPALLLGADRSRVHPAAIAGFLAGLLVAAAVWGATAGLWGTDLLLLLADPGRKFSLIGTAHALVGAGILAGAGLRGFSAPPSPGRSLALGAIVGGGLLVACPLGPYGQVVAWTALVGSPSYGAALHGATAVGLLVPLTGGWVALRSGPLARRGARSPLVGPSTGPLVLGTYLVALWGVLLPAAGPPG